MKYKDAGVDTEAAGQFVDYIAQKSTVNKDVLSKIGDFGAIYDLGSVFKKYDHPVLVSSTDGVGSKVQISSKFGKYQELGIDLVAMSVNDIVVHGAQPLFFLDYISCSKLEDDVLHSIIDGINLGCTQAQCSLVGGETAAMPGGAFDLAGFAVGAVDKANILPKRGQITDGDYVLGLESNGFHANGFSLIRKVLEDQGINYTDQYNSDQTIADMLTIPTKIHVSSCLKAHDTKKIKAFVHITGGGLVENIPRILPENLSVNLDLSPVLINKENPFSWFCNISKTPPLEMLTVFNCGISMVVILDKQHVDTITEILSLAGEKVHILGKVTNKTGADTVQFQNIDKLFS